MKPDGGPAFPQPLYDEEGYEKNLIRGMSLRDYFAAKALQGITVNFDEAPVIDAAQLAYDYADAMLAQRDK